MRARRCPAAWAEAPYYAIELDACGGVLDSEMVIYTNAFGRLTSLPTPTMEGYVFEGWYTEQAGGYRVRTSYVFSEDCTIYAHWSARSVTSTDTSASASAGAQTAQTSDFNWKDHVGTVLVLGLAGALVLAVLASGNS